MIKQEVLKKLKEAKLIPVVRVKKESDAEKVAEALIEAGVKAIEITMTVEGAVEVIHTLAIEYRKEIIIGAGTVLSKVDAKRVIDAGAEFVVSPCFLEEVVDTCQTENILVIPGTLTPTEIIKAYKYGADAVKIFPASSAGGPKFIKSIKAVFPFIPLVPTGGVNIETALDYLKAGADMLGVGTDIVTPALVNEGKFNVITEKAKNFINKITQFVNTGQ